jgi:hypothetical protein
MILAIAPGTSPALVQLAQRERLLNARCEASDEDGFGYDAWQEAQDAIASFPAQSAADVALKIRIATAGDNIERQAANRELMAMVIVAALADLDRIAAAKVAAG